MGAWLHSLSRLLRPEALRRPGPAGHLVDMVHVAGSESKTFFGRRTSTQAGHRWSHGRARRPTSKLFAASALCGVKVIHYSCLLVCLKMGLVFAFAMTPNAHRLLTTAEKRPIGHT